MSHNSRKSVLCPQCRKLVSSDEPRCPYCGLPNPGARWKQGLSRGFLRDPYRIIRFIIYTNVVFYVLSLLLDRAMPGMSANPLLFLSPSNRSLFLLGATGTIPLYQYQWWWTLVSATYLHGGLLHIFFNMMALRQIGPFVVHEYGVGRFFILYTLTGIAGFFLSALAGVSFTIGASASICGLIGATLYYGRSRGDNFGQAIYRQVMGWVVALGLFGFLVPGINNWGHGGGILAGIALGFLLGYNDRKRETGLHHLLALFCLVLTIAILAWAIIQGTYYSFAS